MTDEQFEKLMQAQIAQMTLLQGCYKCLAAMAVKQGVTGVGHNWNDAMTYFDDALFRVNPEEFARRRSQKP